MSVMDDLKAAVAKARTVEASAVALITGLAERIRNAAQDPAELETLAQELDAQTDSLSAAITANTAADPAPADEQPAGDTATA